MPTPQVNTPVDSTISPVNNIDTYVGYYYDSAFGDVMSVLNHDYEPGSVFYVIHPTSSQIVFTKPLGLFVSFVSGGNSVPLYDTFTLNSKGYYISNHSRDSFEDNYTYNQSGYDTVIISANDSLYFKWTYTSGEDCYDPTIHLCGFSGKKQK